MVVDEAVLALTGYRLPDPLDVFYAKREAGVADHRLRSHVLLGRSPEELSARRRRGRRSASRRLSERMDAHGRPIMMSDERRWQGAPGAHPRPHRLRGARALRRERPHRRRRPRPRDREAARQPDPLPRHGGRGLRAAELRLRRGDDRRAPAAHGAPVGAALPELRRPLRAAGRRPEPDRRRDDGGRRGARAERRADRRCRPPPRGGRERSRRGALPDGRRARRDRRASRWAPPPELPPTPPRSSSRSGRRPRPRPSPPTGRSTTGASSSP